jgi:hypothetical protein
LQQFDATATSVSAVAFFCSRSLGAIFRFFVGSDSLDSKTIVSGGRSIARNGVSLSRIAETSFAMKRIASEGAISRLHLAFRSTADRLA